jgi:hypothetical protein
MTFYWYINRQKQIGDGVYLPVSCSTFEFYPFDYKYTQIKVQINEFESVACTNV